MKAKCNKPNNMICDYELNSFECNTCNHYQYGMITKKELENLITGKNIKKEKIKKAVLHGLFLPFGHILICKSGSLFHVKTNYGVYMFNKDEMFERYNIKMTDEIINKLSIN